MSPQSTGTAWSSDRFIVESFHSMCTDLLNTSRYTLNHSVHCLAASNVQFAMKIEVMQIGISWAKSLLNEQPFWFLIIQWEEYEWKTMFRRATVCWNHLSVNRLLNLSGYKNRSGSPPALLCVWWTYNCNNTGRQQHYIWGCERETEGVIGVTYQLLV